MTTMNWHDELRRRIEKSGHAVPAEVTDFARQNGYDGAYYLTEWRGCSDLLHLLEKGFYSVYQPYRDTDAPPVTGNPVMILVKDGKLRLTERYEALEVMNQLYNKEKNQGLEDLSIHPIPKKIFDFAREDDEYLTAIYEGEWRGFKVYTPIDFDPNVLTLTGLPYVILEKEGAIRWSGPQETMDYLDYLQERRNKNGNDDR